MTAKRCSKCSNSRVFPAEDSYNANSVNIVEGPRVIQGSDQSCNTIESREIESVFLAPMDAPSVTDIAHVEDAGHRVATIDDVNAAEEICANIMAEEEDNMCGTTTLKAECLRPRAEVAEFTQGKQLTPDFLDAKEEKRVTLLGRVGRTLSRLVGEGVLWLDKDGKVSAIKDVPLKANRLFHQWVKFTKTSAPILGEPLPYPHKVIADKEGQAFAVRGLSDEPSIEVWDNQSKLFNQVGVSEFPTCKRENLKPGNRMELVGFESVGESGDFDDLRCLKKVQGEGIIVLKQVPTAPAPVCDCGACPETGELPEDSTTCIAEFIPLPDVDPSSNEMLLLAYNVFDGTHKYVNPATMGGLEGPAGAQGPRGFEGDQGPQGPQGPRGVTTNCP